MNWIRNTSWLVLTAVLLLTSVTLGVADGRTAALDPFFPAHAAHLPSALIGHDGAHHHSASEDSGHALGMMGGLPCNVACSVASPGCGPVPLPSGAGSLLHRDAGMICIHPGDDRMLSGLDPDAQLKPPKSIA